MNDAHDHQSDQSLRAMLLRITLASLLLGALTTIAIAWNSAIWNPVPTKRVRYWENGERDDARIRTVFQERMGPASVRRMSSPDPKGDWFYAERPIQWWSELERDPVDPNELIIEDARGWPAFALRSVWKMHTDEPGTRWNSERFTDLTRRSGISLKPRLSPDQSLFPFEGARALPTGVIWSGFVFDTLTWAVIWTLIIDAITFVRFRKALRRYTRQRCMYCKYDLSALEHEQCPECGRKQGRPAYRQLRQLPRVKIGLFVVLLVAIAVPAGLLVRANSRPWTLEESIVLHDIDGIEAALVRGEDPTTAAMSFQGYDHIQAAAQSGDVEAMRMILRNRNVNLNAYSLPPLALACMQDNLPLIRLLLDRGADPNAIFRRRTIFAEALFDGIGLETIKVFLDAGADPDPPASMSSYPPIVAAINGGRQSAQAVEYLLNHGVDVNRSDPNGRTALLEAATWGQREMVHRLIELGADVNASDSLGFTPVLHAISRSDLATIQLLIQSGADPSAVINTGEGAFHLAASNPNAPEIITYLADLGLDVNSQTGDGMTALNVAARKPNNEAVIRALLAVGADPDLSNANGVTPLDAAVQPALLKRLIREIDATRDNPGRDDH